MANGADGDVVPLTEPVRAADSGFSATSLDSEVSPNGKNQRCDTTIFDVLMAVK